MDKKLQRNVGNKVLGGVCSGLGDFLDVEPMIFRILFILLFFGMGAGLVCYLVLWAVMPAGSSDTTPEGTTQRSGRGKLACGLTLIVAGLLLLLRHYIPQIRWSLVWPVILIVIGIALIIPKRKQKE